VSKCSAERSPAAAGTLAAAFPTHWPCRRSQGCAGRRWSPGSTGADRALPAEKMNEAQRAEGAPRFWPPVDSYVIEADQYELWRQGRFNDTPICWLSTGAAPGL